MHLSIRLKAVIALMIVGVIGGIAPLLMKVALKEFNPYQILFLRFGIVVLLISPILVKHLLETSFKKLVNMIMPAGLLYSVNVLFFALGVQYTTGIVSQLLYLLTPVLVSLIGYFLLKETISSKRIMSIIICFGGSSLLIFRSVQANYLVQSIGTFQGNILILGAVVAWALYVIYTKRISQQFEPSLFLAINFVMAFITSCLSLIITKTSIISTVTQLIHCSFPVLMSLLTLATINSILFFFLYQWSIKHVSTFIVASTTYISPLATALFAIPFFGEQLSITLLISAMSIFLGSYFILSEKRQS